jgi:type III secretion system YscQ/HrcQ family protein
LSVIDSQKTWNSLGTLGKASGDAGPLGKLPSLTQRQAKLQERLGTYGSRIGPAGLLGTIADLLGEGITADRFEVFWRPAGLTRPGVIAQLTWPRLATRVGLAIEPPLAHALVDRLLGFERMAAEGRLQVTPVEWGILSFVAARALDRLDAKPGPLGPWDLAIDRVGPDPFDPTGLGPIVTWRWRVRIGQTTASARLWVPEALVALWLLDEPKASAAPPSLDQYADLESTWRAEAGSITLQSGLTDLQPGAILPIDGSSLVGTPASIRGSIRLVQESESTRSTFEARAVPESSGTRLILDSPLTREPRTREILPMSAPIEPTNGKSKSSRTADLPVTIVVELGRVNLTLHRLSELQPGDVIELGRDAVEPVELTSGGRLIARAELVQVDDALGVRIIQLFV